MKVTIIGAGSAAFSIPSIRDLCIMESAPGSTFTLVDVNKERLDAAYGLATRYAKELGVEIKFEREMDRRKALQGADYVINTAFASGHDYTEKMRAVGEQHGYYRGIDSVEFNFVSDYYTILGYKQYQLALDVTADMEDICPDAWMLQVANPIFEVTTLLRRERSKIKTAGFCDEYIGIFPFLLVLGLSPADLYFQVAGFNHCIWLTKFQDVNTGQSLYPVIDDWIENRANEFWRTNEIGLWQETLSPASVDMYKIYGLYPIGDTTRSFTWKYHYDLETAKRWFGHLGGTDSEIGLQLRLQRFQAGLDKLFRLTNDPNAKLTDEVPPTKGHSEFSDFIDASETGKERRLFLNVPNNGLFSQFPNDLTVELPIMVSKGGLMKPEHVDPFPKRLVDFVLTPRMLHMEWGLEAFKSGQREMLVEILIRDPRTRSERQAREAIDAILALPENTEMARHYR
jgi:alpha-galactosidase